MDGLIAEFFYGDDNALVLPIDIQRAHLLPLIEAGADSP